MKTSLIVFPGTNREKDMAMAVTRVTGRAPRIVWHKETDLGSPDLVILPGGFSYGDYLRCGAMAAHSPVMKDVIRLAGRGVRILGVCNGFQILVESRLLPGALLRNRGLKFICRQVCLRTETSASVFTSRMKTGQVLRVPVAHGEGNYFADADTIRRLEDSDRIAFRYAAPDGSVIDAANPNGSMSNIAGVLNESRTILGMMPHPEDAVLPIHANQSGLPLFEGLLTAAGA
jgi:phosphoribosylformylglycinamidine synthase I